ncbi:hypothetical protein [Conexibacter arvalis]|uniref:Uncharacterized protein n=1 Tax=Conexibacter arvalis TaxID=912552 RepID=A0A840IL14_9ACTN|nr:hypothetical protein [Conexibacter arvalis]MBB4664610.1 hypothetical protein [Conexibacter arvalis]
MVLALAATGIVIAALLGEMLLPRIDEAVGRFRARRRRLPVTAEFDPGRDRRAEARARLLLKSCVNDEEWEMYRDLGFIRVWSIEAGRPAAGASGAAAAGAVGETGAGADGDSACDEPGAAEHDPLWDELEGIVEPAARSRGRRWELRRRGVGGGAGEAPYAYLIYPHKPILAFVPQTGRLLSEHCVEFPDETRPYGSARLPDSDDVLAKWMALTGDEQRLLDSANMHLPGRQIDPRQVKRDLWRLRQWERERARAGAAAGDSRVRS